MRVNGKPALACFKGFSLAIQAPVSLGKVGPPICLAIIMFDGLAQALGRSLISAFFQIAVTQVSKFGPDVRAKVDVRASDQSAEETKADESGRGKPRPALPDPLSDKGTPQQQANDSAGPVCHVGNRHDVGLREADAQKVPKHKQ